MAHPTAVILVVGLNQTLLKHAPRLAALAHAGTVRRLRPVLPAVTCSVQASMLTGLPVGNSAGKRGHGIVGNGWYHHDLAEILFWKQSNHLVHGEKVWETARRRDPAVTTANLFWWFNMYSSAEYSVTPRPMYKADGRKIPDCYSQPADLRDRLQGKLGRFPLFQFWGPGADIRSTRWIAEAAVLVHQWHQPTLNLVYLPHLDYALQKLGPGHSAIPEAVRAVDGVAGRLIDYYQRHGLRVMVVSEYGIEPVKEAVHINQALRSAGLLRVRVEQGRELLDAGASDAFAVADHQVAHVYVRGDGARGPTDRGALAGAGAQDADSPPTPAKDQPPPADLLQTVAQLCRDLPGVEGVLDRAAQAEAGLEHPRSGDLVLVAGANRWFSYKYWLDDARAPDFARTVDIHRKPGYDPLELFLDPAISCPTAALAWRLLRKNLGFRVLMDLVPLDSSLVRGSHGRTDLDPVLAPLLVSGRPLPEEEELPCTAVRDVILDHLFGA